jgi:hypothetical protein
LKLYAEYGVTDTEVSLHSITGERFWIKESPQYPKLSHTGKLILFYISDLSGVYIHDKNGLPTGEKYLGGKMALSTSFSTEQDAALIGFLNGTYYLLNDQGVAHIKGKVSDEFIVKTTALSPAARFAAVHYGKIDLDKIRIIDTEEKKIAEIVLQSVHKTKTGIAVSDDGLAYIIDGLYFSVYSTDKKIFEMEIEPQIYGFAKVSIDNNLIVFHIELHRIRVQSIFLIQNIDSFFIKYMRTRLQLTTPLKTISYF